VTTRVVFSLCFLASLMTSTVLPARDPSSIEATVRALDDQARLAALRRDIAALERLWSDSLTVNAPNNQVVVGKRAVLDDFVRTGIINFSSFERHIEFARVDGEFVFFMGIEIVQAKTDSPANGAHRRPDHSSTGDEYLEA
jgi:hypothetical protein